MSLRIGSRVKIDFSKNSLGRELLPEFEGAEGEIDGFYSDIGKVQVKLDKYVQQQNRLTGTLSVFQESVREIEKSEVEQLREENTELKRQLDVARSDIVRVSEIFRKSNNGHQGLKEQHEELQAQYELVRKERNQYRAWHAEYEDVTHEIRELLDSLKGMR